ncbi:SDR family oxidoreductase [uncultured Enterovirga sp.]|uniref:SDR family oxidoreductase n=1 Tax=uncultured Enterovirga sp. TaxID=2026352 RepID=UPI0035CBD72D
MSRKTALIAGATGAVGRGLTESLAASADWDVIALARKPVDVPGTRFIGVDLTREAECRERLAGLSEITHVFFTARFDHEAGQPEPIETNLAMLRHVMDAVEPAATGLRHVHLVHGTKWYGSQLGPFSTPAREDDPRSLADNFYYRQQDFIAERQQGKAWSWSTSRPHGICHTVPDMPRNLVLVLAVYALVSRELGLPLSFPGTPENYRALYQCTSTEQLVAALRWMAEEPACANEAFNVTNGDVFRWANIWPTLARYFGMEVGPVRTVRLANVMAGQAEVWKRIFAKRGLAAPPYERMALWSYGDFVFTPGWDIMSDTTKARMLGFARTVRTDADILRHFDHFRSVGLLPPD